MTDIEVRLRFDAYVSFSHKSKSSPTVSRTKKQVLFPALPNFVDDAGLVWTDSQQDSLRQTSPPEKRFETNIYTRLMKMEIGVELIETTLAEIERSQPQFLTS
jgi:hypothetical protein